MVESENDVIVHGRSPSGKKAMGKLWKAMRYGVKLLVVYMISCALSKIIVVLCAGAVIVCAYIVGMLVATAATVLGLMGEGTWLRSVLSYVEFGYFGDDVFRFSVRIAEKYWRLIAVIGPVASIAHDHARKPKGEEQWRE